MILTIYTPSFNREHLLPRLYESLCKQTNQKFKWLIIDDGSTDQTKMIVNEWQKTSPFEIEYVFKENGGVHTAHNLAYDIVQTDLIWYVDSDDWLENSAVEKILEAWSRRDESCLGIFAKACYANKDNGKASFPNIDMASFQDFYYKYHYSGDIAIVVKTDVVKKISKFPVRLGEKLVAESYKWIQLPDKPFIILDECLVYKEYQTNGYSQNVRKGFFLNLNGYRDLYNIHVKCAKYFKIRVEYCLKYIVTCSFLKEKCVKQSFRPLLTMLLYPIGKILFIVCKRKWKEYK